MSLLEIFLRFLYVGLFTVGGGLASIPLLLQVIVGAGLISEPLFYSMIAIAESTPGPIGINLSTYIGYNLYGVGGGIITSLGLVLPCFIISFLVSRAFERFAETPAIKASFYGIRPIVVGLIAVAAYGVLRITVFSWEVFAASGQLWQIINWKALAVFAVLLFTLMKFKKHPVIYIMAGGIAGLLLF